MNTAKMPKYKSHKTVRALKIESISTSMTEVGATITPANAKFAPFKVSGGYFEKHKPEVGGYFIQYADGYQSYSPAKAFEDGYVLDSNGSSAARNHSIKTEFAGFEKLAKSKFGELLQALYDAEHSFTVEWMWDTGFDWSFSQGSYNGMQPCHEYTKEIIQELNSNSEIDWARDIEYLGGLIIYDYLCHFNGFDTAGKLNAMGVFLESLKPTKHPLK